MKNSEEAHKVTEQIYKNLNDNFIPNLKQLSLSARGFYKALTNAAVAARTYSEALLKIGYTAESRCIGPTQEIGTAMHEISEVYKQFEIQIDEKMKSLMNDISFPVENKLETDFRNMSSSFKKYNQEHKAIVIPFEKAQNTLSKMQRKKSRSNNSDKEAQYAQTISKAQMKLYEHRISGLQKAMTEEWKCHCFVLECVCNTLTLDHNHYAKLHRMIAPRIEHWTRLYTNTDNPLPSLQNMFITGADLPNYTDTVNTDMMMGLPYKDNNIQSFPIQGVHETNEPVFTKRPGTHVYSRSISKSAPTENAYVQSMHSHDATSDIQLSFQEGETIKLVGEKSEGWHYGYNISDSKYGWFPLSFTSPLTPPSEMSPLQNLSLLDAQPLSSRVKSTGDLLSSNDNHINLAPRRSSITNSINDGPSSLPPASPSQQGPVQITDQSYQASTNNIPTPPPLQPPIYSFPVRLPYSTSNIVPQFGSSEDNEYQNLSSLQPNNFETSEKRVINSSPPLPPPPSRQPETDYNEKGGYRYYMRNNSSNEKGYLGPK